MSNLRGTCFALLLALFLLAALAVAPPRGRAQSGNSSHDPTWWDKYTYIAKNGPVDGYITGLRADDVEGQPIAVAVNFHAHPTVMMELDLRAVSRDFPGQVVDSFEAALSGIGKGSEIHERVWYRRTFEVPSDWAGKRVLLHFGAVDYDATIWVGDDRVGRHEGGYTPFCVEITGFLREGNLQTVVVCAEDDPADLTKPREPDERVARPNIEIDIR